jgi:hypothetical protein
MLDGSPSYVREKALAIARNSTILDAVVEVKIGSGKNIDRYSQSEFRTPSHLSPALSTLVTAIPAMPRLHTIHLNHMTLSTEYLYTILSSPHLIHLVLENVQMPTITHLSPPKLRKLTLTTMFSWDALGSLLSWLAASLEYLELRWCKFPVRYPLRLPSFPCLRELQHHQKAAYRTFPVDGQLNELLRLGSRVTHLHLTGNSDQIHPVAFPESLQHLSITELVLAPLNHRIDPLPRLISLSIQCDPRYDSPTLPSFVRDRFPNITSLHLAIPWSLRDIALVTARSQQNVHTLELSFNTSCGLDSENTEFWLPDDFLLNFVLSAPLQTLKLEVVQTHFQLERSVERCTWWLDNIVLPSMTGFGGSELKSIDASFVQPESWSARRRLLCRQWVNGDWKIVE